MPVHTLHTVDDPRVSAFRAVGEPELLHRRGLFVAEGRTVVERVIALDRFRPQALLLSASAFEALANSLARLDPDIPVYVCANDAFLGVTGLHLHRGCLALVERPAPLAPADVVRDARTVVCLEGVANPDNVGGIFRNAAAFGVDGVLLDARSSDPWYRKAIRTSMGATLRVPFARADDWLISLRDLKHRGFCLVALTPGQASATLDAFADLPRPVRLALLLGHEGAGLTEATSALADVCVRIPTTDAVDSLNVAVAAGIALARLRAPHPAGASAPRVPEAPGAPEV